MDSYFLKLSDVKEKLNIENDDDVLDIWFFYDIPMYAKHPDKKDIRKIYEIDKSNRKSVRINFGLTDQEDVYVRRFLEAQANYLDLSEEERKLDYKFELLKTALNEIALCDENGNNTKFDEQPHCFHEESRGIYWEDRLILKSSDNKECALVEKPKILFAKDDLTTIRNRTHHRYQFDKIKSQITVDNLIYPLGAIQYQIVKAIYDLTYPDPTANVKKSNIPDLKEVTKGIPDHFKSDGSNEFRFWSNYIEVTHGKLSKEDRKNSFDKADRYRIKLIKTYNYQVVRIDLDTWLNRPKKD